MFAGVAQGCKKSSAAGVRLAAMSLIPGGEKYSQSRGQRGDTNPAASILRTFAPLPYDTAVMRSRRTRKAGFLRHHSLSIVSVGILLTWCVLYARGDPKGHLGSFFGNAIADWTGVVVTVIATKYFY